MCRRAVPATVLLFLLVLVFSCRAEAQQTIRVPVNQPTIQAGIDAAQDGDIVLVAPGTYIESIDFKGKNITVTSGATSFTAAVGTIIQGVGSASVVSFHTNETRAAVLNGFTFQNGIGTAISLNSSSATISNNAILNYTGCGIVITGSTANPRIEGNDISHMEISPVGEPCTPGAGSGSGITIYDVYGAEIVSNTIENSARSRIDEIPGSSSIYAGLSTTVLIQGNVIRNNANSVSALRELDVTTVSIIQNLIYNNTSQADSGGPAVDLDSTNPYMAPHTRSITFNSNTLFGNTGVPGAGQPGNQFYFTDEFDSGLLATIENNLFISSQPGEAVVCFYPPNDSLSMVFSHNDVLNAGTSLPAQGCTSKGLAVANLAVDPQFLNSAAGNFHTQRSSPVVAVGNVNAPMLPLTDLDGRNRTVCGTVDMGVYEVHPQPSIAITSSNNPSVGGTSVTFTFTATATGNCNVPTGTVTFFDGATPLGTGVLNAGASASFTTASLTVGSHNITVSYAGDFNFDPSTSAILVQVVTGYPTATTLTVSPNPAGAFAPITLSSTVTSGFGVPNGTVSFTAGGTVLATTSLNANGQATATISSLGAGSYPIIATYAATTDYAASSSAAVDETVVGAESTTALSAAPNPAIAGQTVSFTATVKAAQGSALPMGTVVFTDGGATLGSAVLNASGAATFSTATLAPGTHTITATYSGGANFNRSSASVTETVTVIATTASLTVWPNPAGFGQTVTLTTTVMPATGAMPPTGTVTFLDGGTAIGTGSLSAAGVATFSTATLAVGTHSLTAAYAGAGSLGASTSPAVSETIIASAFSLSLTPSTLTLRPGQTGAVTVQLASTGGYAGTLALGSGPLPAYVTGVFNPTSVMLPSNGSATATFTLSTQVFQAQTQSPSHGRDVLLSGGLLTCLLAPIGALRRRRISIFLLFGVAAILLATNGCSNLGSAIHTVAPGMYIIPVTAADANGSQKTSTFTLVIAQ